jgi:hypothetical protein
MRDLVIRVREFLRFRNQFRGQIEGFEVAPFDPETRKLDLVVEGH